MALLGSSCMNSTYFGDLVGRQLLLAKGDLLSREGLAFLGTTKALTVSPR